MKEKIPFYLIPSFGGAKWKSALFGRAEHAGHAEF